jgi:hypothetical protein
VTTPRINVSESPSYNHPAKAGVLLKQGWKRGYITVYDEETAEKIVTCLMYFPPHTDLKALEHLLELGTV